MSQQIAQPRPDQPVVHHAVPSAWAGVFAVWQRNALVWRKLVIPSFLANVIDPVIALLAFGLGLGSLLPEVGGHRYLDYLACGTLAMSAMNAATFEALYSAFSRMHVQKTWDAILNTPVSLRQIVLGEWLWAASKSLMSCTAMIGVVACLGIGDVPFWLAALPISFIGALMFAALALCVNARAHSYDFFMFYFTLVVTPMTFVSGAFFPRAQLPLALRVVADWLPLSVLVDAVRHAFEHAWGASLQSTAIVLLYGAAALYAALRLSERRLGDS
ncbi:MAG: ABC transporter permease [Burkholderiaceae bacterium]